MAGHCPGQRHRDTDRQLRDAVLERRNAELCIALPVLLAAVLAPLAAAAADDVLASAGDRSFGHGVPLPCGRLRLDLDELGGFALVTETRTVSIPAGESRIRFEGVADGIQPASAIITGLPTGVLEKNHDAQVLSPAALVGATVGRAIGLHAHRIRRPATRLAAGTLRSDADGVVFESADG